MLLRRCLGPGQGDKGSLFPIKQADICQLTSIQRGDVEAAECKTKWPSLLTGPWHTIERSESSKEKESQKGQDSSHMEKASLEQIPRAKKKHVEKKKLSPERAPLCALWVKRAWLCKGALPPAGTLQNEFFFFCLGSANFLLPLSQGSEPLRQQSARRWGLAAAVAAC